MYIVKYAMWYIIFVTAFTNFLLDATKGLQHGVLLYTVPLLRGGGGGGGKGGAHGSSQNSVFGTSRNDNSTNNDEKRNYNDQT